MSTIDRMLGKPQVRLELRLQLKLLRYLKEEALKEGKSVNGIIRDSLIDRYIKLIVADMREDIRQQVKTRRANRLGHR